MGVLTQRKDPSRCYRIPFRYRPHPLPLASTPWQLGRVPAATFSAFFRQRPPLIGSRSTKKLRDMEEGSLLKEAIERGGGNLGEWGTKNTLTVDVYYCWSTPRDESDDTVVDKEEDNYNDEDSLSVVTLRAVCADLNRFIRMSASGYPWFVAVPFFELNQLQDHCHDDSVPSTGDGDDRQLRTAPRRLCLRAVVEYGLQVADEWMMVHLLLAYTAKRPDLAAECRDDDDGQVLLIESAHVLPEWVDDDAHAAMGEGCRHRCWIRSGRVRLLSPQVAPSASVDEALLILGGGGAAAGSTTASREDPDEVLTQQLTQAIHSAIKARVLDVQHTHRALVFLPRSLVESSLLTNHPHLVIGPAARGFVDHASSSSSTSVSASASASAYTASSSRVSTGCSYSSQNFELGPSLFSGTRSNVVLDGFAEDWMWTTLVFGRTHYAMLRQFCSPSWPDSDSVPGCFVEWLAKKQQYQSPSNAAVMLKRLSTFPPHAKHAICVGVRLLVGLGQLLQKGPSSAADKTKLCRSSDEWKQLQSGLERCFGERPLQPAHQTEHNHEILIPEPPSFDHVDVEDWMNISEQEMQRLTRGTLNPTVDRLGEPFHAGKPTTAALENVLGGVKAFMGGTSDVLGVDTVGAAASSVAGRRPTAPSTDASLALFVVDPVAVLNLLHATLKAPTAEDLIVPLKHPDTDPQTTTEADTYFSEQDYQDLIVDDEDDDDSSTSSLSQVDENEPVVAASDLDDPDDIGMRELMRAMDLELNRAMDVTDDDLRDADDDPETVESMHLLSNLLKSLESSSGPGSTGPLQNMLKEMGIEPPDVWSPSV